VPQLARLTSRSSARICRSLRVLGGEVSEEADFFRIKAWNSQEDADGYHPFIVIVSRNKGLKTGSRRSPAASGGQGKKTRGQENHWLGVVRFLVGEHGPLFAGRNNLNYGLLLLKVVA